MNYKTIRFQSIPIMAGKENPSLPKSKYANKLHTLLQIYCKYRKITETKGSSDNRISETEMFESIKQQINNVYIFHNCVLYRFPIKLSANDFVETDYIEPYWDAEPNEIPKYIKISKKYILLEEEINERIKIIKYNRLEAYKQNKPVKIYSISTTSDFTITKEE